MVADAMLEGARQCPHMEWISVQRMLRDLAEAAGLITEPSHADQRDRLLRVIANVQAFDRHCAETDALIADFVGQLQSFKDALDAEADLTYTVVFMPYNAAMWDCLHTIWQAADADPLCEAIVVPVPYLDRKPDGSFAAIHDHTALFPPEVRITPLSEFDLAAAHPDVTYLHNPYDAHNFVTSVHPDFYAEKLRPHTEMLVYVPYYVTYQQMPDLFDKLPPYRFFDRVIAQSERFGHQMIELWSSSKVVPLGSPKFDYVRTASGGALPPEWSERVAEKKVLLQVTSVDTFLKGEAAVVRKLDDVLDVVERHKDLVLWWRPHPLERATIASKMPELADEYAAYAARAAASGQVIVDDSMDLQRAILAADAYYGHESSIVALFGLTGKPMVIQGAEIATDAARPVAPGDDVGPEFPVTRYKPDEWRVYEGAVTYLRRMVEQYGDDVPDQRVAFEALAANSDGTAGQHIHDYIMSCL